MYGTHSTQFHKAMLLDRSLQGNHMTKILFAKWNRCIQQVYNKTKIKTVDECKDLYAFCSCKAFRGESAHLYKGSWMNTCNSHT